MPSDFEEKYYLKANLVHNVDLGKNAFVEAESCMDRIELTSSGLYGTVSCDLSAFTFLFISCFPSIFEKQDKKHEQKRKSEEKSRKEGNSKEVPFCNDNGSL